MYCVESALNSVCPLNDVDLDRLVQFNSNKFESKGQKLRVFLTAPNMDFDATGESYVAWRWAEALSHKVELTVFAFQTRGREPLSSTLPNARVLTSPLPRLFSRFKRFDAMAKPYYPAYMRAVRQAFRATNGEIDIAHQIMPQAARYPSPLNGLGVPYIIGPLGGALSTPTAFRSECGSAKWYTRLRAIDAFRFKHDPWLRRSYMNAEIVLGVAPYVRELLSDMPLKRFEPLLELGISELPSLEERKADETSIRLLHVGRGVRTKGLRDVIRAMGLLKDRQPNITLDSAGIGEEIEICRGEANSLGIGDRVTFHGQITRSQVDALYAKADIFVFPSFREPAGNVLYEAMSWGLPVIAAARGGPDWIVDSTTGIKVPVTNPRNFSIEIASAIARLCQDKEQRKILGEGAKKKVAAEGLWPTKAETLISLYKDVYESCRTMKSSGS